MISPRCVLHVTALLLAATFFGCTTSPEEPFDSTTHGTLSIEFDNIVGDKNLQLNTGSYKNAAGEDFTVSMVKYYISNIILHKEDGSTFIVPQDSSYFLIDESNAETRLAKVQAPEGEYTSLTFTIGVDSARSTMDLSKRTGVLDPTGGMEDGMYWSWNSGYIFFRMEGISPEAPLDPSGQNKFRYHIGGFGGYETPTINNIRTVTLDLRAGGAARVRKERKSNIHLMVDLGKVFNGPTQVSIATNPTVMFGEYSTTIANNYVSMFRHDHTEN